MSWSHHDEIVASAKYSKGDKVVYRDACVSSSDILTIEEVTDRDGEVVYFLDNGNTCSEYEIRLHK